MYVELPGSSHSRTIADIRGYTNLEDVKRRVAGSDWRTIKIYRVFDNQPPRRLLKKELLELGAVDLIK